MTAIKELGVTADEEAFEAHREATAIGEQEKSIVLKRNVLAGFPGTVFGVSLAYDHAVASFDRKRAERKGELLHGVSVLALGYVHHKELTA